MGRATRWDATMVVYPDTGCIAGGPSCLACPLPECVEDRPARRPPVPHRPNVWSNEQLSLFVDGPVAMACESLGISRRQFIRRRRAMR